MEAAPRPEVAGRRVRAAADAAALVGYLVLGVLLHGRAVVGHLDERSVGVPGDAAAFAWFVGWWPHALAAGANPLRMDAVWAPEGITAAWATGVPTLALAAWPITALAGPVVSVNVLMLAAPGLAAWTAYLLARDVTGSRLAALPAGFLFGFSAFVTSHMLGHLNLAFVVALPLLPLIALRVGRGQWRCRWGAVAFGVVVALQLGISSELALLATVFGALALGIAAAVDSPSRPAVARILRAAVPGWLIAAVLASPLLLAQVTSGAIGWHPARRRDSQDLLGTIIPDATLLVSPFDGVSNGFTTSLAERGAYVSVVGVAILVALWLIRDGRVERRLPPILGLAAFVLALGPVAHVAGRELPIPLPSAGLIVMPVATYAISGRFVVFLALAVAIAAAVLVAARPRWWSVVLVAAACVAVLPDVAAQRWAPATTPSAVRDPAVVPDHARVVLVPVSEGMRWQAVDGFRFDQVGGYTGVILPEPYRPWRDVVDGLLGTGPLPSAERLDAYLRTFGAERVVLGPGTPTAIAEALVSAGWSIASADGVDVAVPPSSPR